MASVCGEHCNGEFMHCSCPNCHGAVTVQKATPVGRNECGPHCMGFVGEDGELTSPNSRIHCKCNDCHGVIKPPLNIMDPTISFSAPKGTPKNV